MKIVICATTFPPALGGLENVAEMTADALGRGGDEVTVLTRTPGPDMPDRAYRLIRRPSFAAACRACRAADAAVLVNVGLKMLPPLLAARTPFAIWHQTLHLGAHGGDRVTWPERIKDQVVRRLAARNLGCSDYVTATLPADCPRATVANPYDATRMFAEPDVTRDGDLLFVGRLVSDKGVDVLLRALALPPLAGARLAIVGQGPEQPVLEKMVAQLGLNDRVNFLGPQTGATLRGTLSAHRVLVVPSVWEEPFGIVALEGLACGCDVVVARSGGLPEAVGAHGAVFAKGDAEDAARVIAGVRARGGDGAPDTRAAHLEAHRAAATAARLHGELARMIGGGAAGQPPVGRRA